MTALHEMQYDPKIYKKALDNLLKLKTYHMAPPTKKNKMLKKEYQKILNNIKVKNNK